MYSSHPLIIPDLYICPILQQPRNSTCEPIPRCNLQRGGTLFINHISSSTFLQQINQALISAYVSCHVEECSIRSPAHEVDIECWVRIKEFDECSVLFLHDVGEEAVVRLSWVLRELVRPSILQRTHQTVQALHHEWNLGQVGLITLGGSF